MYLPAPDESIWVGVLRIQFKVPGSRSLKDKRRIVSQLKDRIAARHKAHVAEVGWLEEHTRGVVAVVMVGNDARLLRSALDQITSGVGSWSEALVEGANVDVMRPWNDGPDEGYDR